MIPSDLLQTWTRPAALGFATSAVRTDSVVRLGTVVGRAGRIEGEDTSGPPFTLGGHRVQVYRVFLVGQRLFHVWAASLHGRALPPDAPAFLESLKIQCDPSRPCGRGTGATVAPNPTQTWYDFQVERPAREIPDSPAPRYPDALKAAKVAGEVVTWSSWTRWAYRIRCRSKCSSRQTIFSPLQCGKFCRACASCRPSWAGARCGSSFESHSCSRWKSHREPDPAFALHGVGGGESPHVNPPAAPAPDPRASLATRE